MHVLLTENDKHTLRGIAEDMGVAVNYYYHAHDMKTMYFMSNDGYLTTITPDSWLAEMLVKMHQRIKQLEEKVGVY
jgi:hypothetical protein